LPNWSTDTAIFNRYSPRPLKPFVNKEYKMPYKNPIGPVRISKIKDTIKRSIPTKGLDFLWVRFSCFLRITSELVAQPLS